MKEEKIKQIIKREDKDSLICHEIYNAIGNELKQILEDDIFMFEADKEDKKDWDVFYFYPIKLSIINNFQNKLNIIANLFLRQLEDRLKFSFNFAPTCMENYFLDIRNNCKYAKIEEEQYFDIVLKFNFNKSDKRKINWDVVKQNELEIAEFFNN